MKIKTVLMAAAFAAASAALSALPGVTQYIPDVSGEYVFYRDTSFERTAFVGFVYYDESTYGVRYYAPAGGTKKQPLAEKDIQLYFTVDAAQTHFEPTGERIVGAVSAEDTDIVNYLHDMLYEFTARRQLAGDVTSTRTVEQNFPQFGGDVALEFNAFIPVFNLQCIKSLSGSTIFQVVTTGILSVGADGATDSSFTDFKGFPAKLKDSTHPFKPNKKAAPSTYTYTKDDSAAQTITLDSQWMQYADNFFFLGKNALLTFDIVPAKHAGTDQLVRSLIRNTKSSYSDWEHLSIKTEGAKTVITVPVYAQDSNSIMQSCKVIEKLSSGANAFLIMTVFDGAYTKNQAYFESVLNSYTVTTAK